MPPLVSKSTTTTTTTTHRMASSTRSKRSNQEPGPAPKRSKPDYWEPEEDEDVSELVEWAKDLQRELLYPEIKKILNSLDAEALSFAIKIILKKEYDELALKQISRTPLVPPEVWPEDYDGAAQLISCHIDTNLSHSCNTRESYSGLGT